MTEPNVANLRKASVAIYAATEEGPARDISNLFQWAAARIEQLEAANKISIASAMNAGGPSIDWLRWTLEEIVRCTEPKAGSGDRFICRIAEDGLRNAGFPGPHAIAKPEKIA